MRRALVEKTNEATPAGELLGKQKKESTSAKYIPKSPAILDLGIVINQPCYLENADEETLPIQDGFPIAEVFKLQLITGKKNLNKIHGTVWIQCGGFGRLNLFQKSRISPQIVHPKESLELACSINRAFAAFDRIFVGLHLIDGRDKVVDDTFLMYIEVYHAQDSVYSDIYTGAKNSVKWKLSYVVYREAVVGTIEIKFKPSSNNNSSIEISGSITAYSSMIPDCKMVLFCKKSDIGECYCVENRGEYVFLPLLRSVAAVPLSSVSIQDCEEGHYYDRPIDGCLLIDVNLVNNCDGGEIAKGVFKFRVENYGDYVGTVISKYGEIQVKVFFERVLQHLPSEAKFPELSDFV